VKSASIFDEPPACAVKAGVACLCTGVSHAEVAEVVAADPRATVESLGAVLGCGLQCGSCVPALKEALGDVAWFTASASGAPITRCEDEGGLGRLIYRVRIELDADAMYPRVLAGQHVVLRATTRQGAVERTYTVVSQDRQRLSLTVAIRRTPGGRFSPWLLDALAAGEEVQLEVSVPGGRPLGSAGRHADVFFAGGVGVTPAAAMAIALPPTARMHLHYSVSGAGDAAFIPEFEARRRDGAFSYSVRDTAARGPLSRGSIRRMVREFPDGQFYICGPKGYVDHVHGALKSAQIDPERIHVERFELAARAPKRSARFKSYLAGALLALVPLLLLLPNAEAMRPHGHANVGHESLKCVACHAEAPGSARQTLQAKAKHLLGLRETGAVLGKQAVTSATCTQCHANPDDRHAPNRFLEPRFEQARAETGAQLCVSCHREHTGTRLTAANPGYCVSCHSDLKVKNDKVAPTHDYLVSNKRWETCLQCHDYHGNHNWSTPRKLQDATQLDVLDKYLKGGPSPFGPAVIKAKESAS
jgi:ferredoxin-NADP reductase/bacterioferritin-associated ferredoxin